MTYRGRGLKSSSGKYTRRRRQGILSVEAMEPRIVLSVLPALVLTGTEASDTINLSVPEANELRFTLNGTDTDYDMTQYSRIELDALGGDDTITVAPILAENMPQGSM